MMSSTSARMTAYGTTYGMSRTSTTTNNAYRPKIRKRYLITNVNYGKKR